MELNSSLKQEEKTISELEDSLSEIIESGKQKEKIIKKSVQSLLDMWDTYKCA